MKRLDAYLLLNNTGILSEKHREYMEEVAREIDTQIELSLLPNFNDIAELVRLSIRAAKFGIKDNDYRKVLEDVYELLEENKTDEAKKKLKISLNK